MVMVMMVMMDGDGWTGHCHGCSVVVPHQLIMDTGVAEMQIRCSHQMQIRRKLALV